MIEPEQGWPERELNARELSRYLLGDSRVPADTGLLGRMALNIRELDAKVDRLIRWARALFITALAALLALVADLIVALGHH
ncbi:MAG TPA: hypothetical protein VJX92_18950 [Methylomirabilota bacterium]|nr:hypothetical protein [Methylomirabilota bacterium]